MRDTELYRHLLGLSAPWSVDRVEMNIKERRVDVFARHSTQKSWPCPECEASCPLHDHDEERTWRHLDSCQFTTVLHGRIPRIRCKTHGVRQVRVSWAERGGRFTSLFERWAIDVLQETSVQGGADLLGISWDEAHHIMQCAVERGLLRREKQVPKKLGIDEKSIGRGKFVTVATDLDLGIVLNVAEGRTKQSVYHCLGSFSLADLAGVEAVGIDMSQTYFRAIHACVEGAAGKIVFDRFHIVQHMTSAVDKVRRAETTQHQAEGDDRLVGSRWMWLYGRENLPDKYKTSFEALRDTNLRTARAWAIKEQLRDLWDQQTLEEGEAWWKTWFNWASHCRLDPVTKVARMIKTHLPNVLTYFTHAITSATTEALNGVIKGISKRAYGFRNFQNFRTAVLFRCGGLQLHPATC